MKHIKLFILFFILSSFFVKGQQIQIGSSTDSIQFSKIISGNDSSLYFLGKNGHELLVIKTDLSLDTLWTMSYPMNTNYFTVNGYQLPGSDNVFLWMNDSTILKMDKDGQIISRNHLFIPGVQFLNIGAMLLQNDTLLVGVNYLDSVIHSGIAFADTNLTIFGYHEYTSSGIYDIQKFRNGYYLKSAALIFLDSAFNAIGINFPPGYTQYQQGGRSFRLGNVLKINDSTLFVHQVVRHDYEPTQDDHYMIYGGAGLTHNVFLKDDFDFAPSFEYKLLNAFSDGKLLLLGQNLTGFYSYLLDSTNTIISVSKIIADTGYSIYGTPTLFVNDKAYFAHRNIIGVIDTLANSCNSTSASIEHIYSFFSQANWNFAERDTSYALQSSTLSTQPPSSSRGILTDDYCNIVGIKNISNKNSFEVYPNPFIDHFEITTSDSNTRNYILIDPLGRIQARIKGTSSPAKITNLCSGIYYLVEIETGNYKCLVKE